MRRALACPLALGGLVGMAVFLSFEREGGNDEWVFRMGTPDRARALRSRVLCFRELKTRRTRQQPEVAWDSDVSGGAMSTKHGSHWLEREDCGTVTLVRLRTPKTLDADTSRAVFDAIYTIVDHFGRNKLVLNLGAVELLPSPALGKWVMLNRKVQVGKGRLALCQLSAGPQEVLATTHLNDVFDIYDTEEAAMQSFE